MTENITTLITGAGAVKNSWDPIVEMLIQVDNRKFENDTANSYLAQLVYLMRFYCNKSVGRDTETSLRVKEQYYLLKELIAKSLSNAQKTGKIYVQPKFADVLNRFVANEKLAIVNCNWDTVVDHEVSNIRIKVPDIIHLHGSIEQPNNLYFPSEIVEETYRPENEKQFLGKTQLEFLEQIKSSSKIILYGISLDPLDAELNIGISHGRSDRLKEIIVIDPKHDIVSKRARMLMDKNPIRITGYEPGNLGVEVEY